VLPKYRTARWAGLSLVILFVATVAFGAKLWQKATTDYVLPPITDDGSADGALGPGSGASDLAGDAYRFAPLAGGVSAIPGGDRMASASTSAVAANTPRDRKGEAAVNRWTPWGNASWRRGGGDSTFSSGSASLGGLWHAMSPFGHSAGAADTAVVTTTTARVQARSTLAAKPKPEPRPAPRPSPPSAAPPSASATDPAAPGSGLGEDTTPLPGLADPPGPGGSGGGLGGGSGSGGGGLSSGGDMSSNPEPGTIALFGTGLVGLIQVLRRRRL